MVNDMTSEFADSFHSITLEEFEKAALAFKAHFQSMILEALVERFTRIDGSLDAVALLEVVKEDEKHGSTRFYQCVQA